MQRELEESFQQSSLQLSAMFHEKISASSLSSSQSMATFRFETEKQLRDFQTGLQQRFNDQFMALSEKMNQSMSGINERVEVRLSQGFDKTNETFESILQRMAIIDQAQENIRTLSQEMVSLQDILGNNQRRGQFGEFQLNQLLFAAFKDRKELYEIQYTLRDPQGKRPQVRADAVVFLPGVHGMVCIDSKFPFAQYQKLYGQEERLSEEEEAKTFHSFGRDVKKHIDDIAEKYIIEGTTADYALMFVASDGILALLYARFPSLIEYAASKRVHLVSPTILFPLLSSYHALAIDYRRSQNATLIRQELVRLAKEFARFEAEWKRLSGAIRGASRSTEEVGTRVDQLTRQFSKIKDVDFIETPAEPLMQAETTAPSEEE
jgi:DNA recombination protein RmuC